MPRPHSQASEHRPATPVTPIGKKQGRPQENGASPKATKDTKLNDTDNNVAEKRAKTEHLAPPLASQKAAAPPLDETDHPSPGLERKESHHPRSRSQTFIQRKDSAGYERRAEAWGAFAQALINLNPLKLKGYKPKDKLREIIRHVIKVTRIRGVIVEFFGKLCPICTSLELTQEKFIVRDRVQSLKQTRFSAPTTFQKPDEGAFPIGSGTASFRLGSLASIWRKSSLCPLCRLVMHSLREQQGTSWITINAILTKKSTLHETREDELKTNCFISWQIDGRESIRDPHTGVLSSNARTRRIRLHWENDRFEESFLVLVGGKLLPMNDIFLGRRIEIGRTNPALMKSWIDSCYMDHGEPCRIQPDPRFDVMVRQAYFGVIDVLEMRLTRLPPDKKYVALSYTWGDPKLKPYRTVLSNVREVQAPRGIDKVFSALPETIRNSINLVRELGERYLWVDSICIVQDSRKSWELNAKVMDLVYGNAHFTICAADGEDPRSGLRGMNPKQRNFAQHMEYYSPGVRLMVSYLVETYIKSSAWSSRAWTFQERMLSKRCLIFIDSRVFFQCRCTTRREDISAEETTGWSIDHMQAPLQIMDNLDTRAMQIYMKSVEQYTARKLTRAEDILSAFDGIGGLVSRKLGSNILFGLPTSHFDFVLLWEACDAADTRWIYDGPRPKKDKGIQTTIIKDQDPSLEEAQLAVPEKPVVPSLQSKDEPPGRRDFPSWSWSGWEGSIFEYKASTTQGCLSNLREWFEEHTWIMWYVRDGHGNLKPVWDQSFAQPGKNTQQFRWKGYGFPNPSREEIETDSYERRLRWPGEKRSEFSKTIPEYPFGVNLSTPETEPDVQFPDQRFLQFWSWSAYLRLTEHRLTNSPSKPLGKDLKRYGITDYKGDWCGTIVLDVRREKDFESGGEYKFIAISEAKEFSREEYNGWVYYISKEREQSEWDLYYVLLIEVKDEIAYRVGLGKVYKEAFENSCREEKKWEEFILG